MFAKLHFLTIIGWILFLDPFFRRSPCVQVKSSPLLKHLALLKHRNTYADLCALLV